jgi:hypothetical protein
MVGLSSSDEVGLMSANPRLAAQASCERIGKMRIQITESQPGLTVPGASICWVSSDPSDNENSKQVTRRRVRHSLTPHHRFIGGLGGCPEPSLALQSIRGFTYTLTVRSERKRSHWFVKLVECELGADGVIMEDFRLANIEEMEHVGGGIVQGSWKYWVEDTRLLEICGTYLRQGYIWS